MFISFRNNPRRNAQKNDQKSGHSEAQSSWYIRLTTAGKYQAGWIWCSIRQVRGLGWVRTLAGHPSLCLEWPFCLPLSRLCDLPTRISLQNVVFLYLFHQGLTGEQVDPGKVCSQIPGPDPSSVRAVPPCMGLQPLLGPESLYPWIMSPGLLVLLFPNGEGVKGAPTGLEGRKT